MTSPRDLLAAADHEAICKGGPCAAPIHHGHVADILLATPSGSKLLARIGEAEAKAERLARLVVSYADLTHATVNGGDWQDIAKEWSGVVAACRASLTEPTDG